jgi:hypothetical protein
LKSAKGGAPSVVMISARKGWATRQGGAPDPLVSPTAFQLGAFTYDWQVNGNSVNLTVNNPATLNSFFYHIPAKLGIANKKSGMFRTINQTFNLSFDNPCP